MNNNLQNNRIIMENIVQIKYLETKHDLNNTQNKMTWKPCKQAAGGGKIKLPPAAKALLFLTFICSFEYTQTDLHTLSQALYSDWTDKLPLFHPAR